MAKKKKDTGYQDTEDMSKKEIKAYREEICAHFLENGWRAILAYYKLSTKEAAKIIKKVKDEQAKEKAAEKADAKADAKSRKTTKKAKKKAPKRAPKKAPKKAKAEKPPKAAPKKPGRKPGRKPAATAKVDDPKLRRLNIDLALRELLRYRKKCGAGLTLDEAIVEISLSLAT